MDDTDVKILIGELKADVRTVLSQNSNIFERMNSLPCKDHSLRVDALLEWKKSCNGFSQAERIETLKGKFGLYIALIGGGCGIVGAGITVVVNLIFTGNP